MSRLKITLKSTLRSKLLVLQPQTYALPARIGPNPSAPRHPNNYHTDADEQQLFNSPTVHLVIMSVISASFGPASSGFRNRRRSDMKREKRPPNDCSIRYGEIYKNYTPNSTQHSQHARHQAENGGASSSFSPLLSGVSSPKGKASLESSRKPKTAGPNSKHPRGAHRKASSHKRRSDGGYGLFSCLGL